ncbi:hypothetical protein BDDG_12206 [Blastomyces dermatitidis ATCC 18188]|uniref:Uncharacterized protein n=1 Tax=Ajellomyces dermatitidis (strain ATCC 18188 / CBS 674.68) TaxID=653446 RepID=A0A0J9ER16_AJEDA|nr:hypothetical protein BDDG_12206 [Blastomyces dermatitidis ATCC 18188]
MPRVSVEELLKHVKKCQQLADSCGFTIAYQKEKESSENMICHRKKTPATDDKYARVVENWILWRVFHSESADKEFAKHEPDLSI